MPSPQSHRHHYVPKWYQHRFLDAGQTAFKILDLKPEVFRDKSGKVRGHGRSILDKGPDAHFWEPDLYTVRFLGQENDDIERLLFGAIDKSGQTAIDAWLAEDYNTVHDTYIHMYEFMDALRLRTPKGLRFLQSLSAKRDQLSLMMAMQHFRRMHCIMWAEGTLEIVNATESPTKFIFTDHPVTLFNSHVFPSNPLISPSADPNCIGKELKPYFLLIKIISTFSHTLNGRALQAPTRPRKSGRTLDISTQESRCFGTTAVSEAENLTSNRYLQPTTS